MVEKLDSQKLAKALIDTVFESVKAADKGFGRLLSWIEDNDMQDTYTNKIDAPIYEPTEEKPKIKDLFDYDKTNALIEKINKSKLKKAEKDFLINAAYRHITFNYSNIADYYAHSSKEMQELMEESALIIIDFEKAIAQGYLQLREEITTQYIEEYGEEE